MSCDYGRDKMRLASTSSVHFAHPGVQPIVLLVAIRSAGVCLDSIFTSTAEFSKTSQAAAQRKEVEPELENGYGMIFDGRSEPQCGNKDGDQDSDEAGRTFCRQCS